MPTFTYDKRDLLDLIGKRLSDKELERIINSIKPSVERITEEEITIEHTPDRPDLFGIEGLARAIRLALGIEKKKLRVKKSGLRVRVEKVKIRPFVACAVVRNVKLNDRFIRSLMHIQDALTDTLGRKRRKVAIGIHDLDKIKPPITYTSASPKTKMIPLGGKKEMSLEQILEKEEKGREYGYIISSAKKWPVFIDSLGVFSFPPIINSERTRVTEETRNLFLELTAIEERALNQCLNILVTNFAERGCEIESVELIYPNKKLITPELKEERLKVSLELVKDLSGLELSEKELLKCLSKMGFNGRIRGNWIEVKVPPYRADILHEFDLVEDIIIGYGFDRLKPELPNLQTKGKVHPLEKFSRKIRVLMVGLGGQEVIMPILTSPEKQFRRMEIEEIEHVELENPVSTEYSMPRVWLLPGLLEFFSHNKHVEYPQRIFELGDVVLIDEKEETKCRQVRRLSYAISDSRATYEDISSILGSFFNAFNLKFELKETEHKSFIKGRVAEVMFNKKPIGLIGEISPKVLENWKLENPVAAFEISLDELFEYPSEKPME